MINTHISPSIVDNYHSSVINSTSRSCKPRFAQETSSIFTQFIQLNKTKSYVSITGCVLEHILHCPILTNNEKLFYLIADSLSLINSKNATKKRYVALPATKWAEKINCSKNEIFTMQKSLEAKGYFIVVRDKNEFGKNQRNIITPSLPNTVFHYLSKSPNRLNHEVRDDNSPVTSLTSSLAFSHCINIEKNKRVYLDKTKLFIRLNYQLLLLIASSDQLTSFAKVLWLDFYTKCYKYHMKLKNTDTGGDNNDFACTTSYKELETKYSCTKSTLSKTMNILEKLGFIDKKRFYVKNDNKDDNLHDKSLWNITLSLPKELAQDITNLKPRANPLLEYDYQANSELDISCTDPYVVNFGQLLNKDSELNNKDFLSNLKDSDSLDIDKKNNFFENFNQTPIPSELSVFYKNSFEEKPNSNVKLQKIDFEIPINKDFTKTISLEKYGKQDREVATTSSDSSIPVELSNHVDTQTTTTIQSSSTNDSKITKPNNKALTQPKSLNQGKPLKSFYPLSKEQVNKLNSLSGRQFSNGEFSVNFANQLLLKLSRDSNKLFPSKNHMMSYMSKAFRYEKHQAPMVNHESFKFTVNVSDTESIAERQRKKPSIYGNIDINYEKIATKSYGIYKKSPVNSKINLSEVNLEDIDPNSIWYKVRKELKRQLYDGEYVDKAWFSKLTAEEDKTTNTITLYAPSKFICESINSRYGTKIMECFRKLTNLKFEKFEEIEIVKIKK